MKLVQSDLVASSANGQRYQQLVLLCILSSLFFLPPSTTLAVTFTNLHLFENTNNGANPRAALVQATDKNFYGTTFYGGINGNGTVFKITPDGAFTLLHAFTGASDGSYPYASLIQASDGNFYGTCSSGGAHNGGVVFAMTSGGALTVVHSFAGGNDGAYPFGSLIQGNDGNFYGTTESGGSHDQGVVFKMTAAGAVTTLHAFGGGTGIGAYPYAGLVQGSDGNFYGTAYAGGVSNYGTIFKITAAGTLTVLHSFTNGIDGSYPYANLIQGSDGNFYGTAFAGGNANGGTVFKVSSDGTFTTLHLFNGGNAGDQPNASLIQATDGNFYGTTSDGDFGAIFKMSAAGTLTVLHSFNYDTDGSSPSTLIIGNDGSLYGTTYIGGFVQQFYPVGSGTVFKYAANLQVQPPPPPPSLTITPLRVTLQQANVAPTDAIDAPIVPFADTNLLAQASTPLGMGVVADGVTPVLFNITGTSGNYTLAITNNATNLNAIFYTNLFVLQNGAWVNTTNITIPDGPNGMGTNWVYLQGLDWGQFVAPPSYQPIKGTMSVNSTALSYTTNIVFEIRPPPIVLVHGYNANASSWTASFTNVLTALRPPNFVVAINYATANDENTTDTLDDLAHVLDGVLTVQEASFTNWAFTRYDIVGHSQGGVLARMLCQNLPSGKAAFSSLPVVSEKNYYRGRFRRIITIGSPHNGSVFLYYLLTLENSWNPFFSTLIPWKIGKLAQPKFNPFGSQIAEINNPNIKVDPRIKFICIQTTLYSGRPPIPLPGLIPVPAYDFTGLNIGDLDTLKLLFPNGTDGAVDFESQGAGIGTKDIYISSPDIAHANDPWLFAVPDEQSQTTFPLVAQTIIGLLNGPASSFGPFILPSQLPYSEMDLINSLVTPTITENLIAGISSLQDLSSYNFSFTQPSGVPQGGQITWYAQVFGSNGISSDNISWIVNSNNPSDVTLTVTNPTAGSVIIYATYAATNGVLVFATPVVVTTRPLGNVLSGIELLPSASSLEPGQAVPLEIWGDYTNGMRGRLFTQSSDAAYYSSDTNVAMVDTNGIVTLNSFGSAEITADYANFSAHATISSITPSIKDAGIGFNHTEGFQLWYFGTAGVTNIIEVSTNLVDWFPFSEVPNSNGFVQVYDSSWTNYPERFFHIMLP